MSLQVASGHSNSDSNYDRKVWLKVMCPCVGWTKQGVVMSRSSYQIDKQCDRLGVSEDRLDLAGLQASL